MHIKSTKTYTTAAGKPGCTYRIVQNTRVGKQYKHKTLLNLGSKWAMPRASWKQLIGRVDELLHKQMPLWPHDPKIEVEAEEIVRRLREKGFGKPDDTDSAVATVDLNTLDHTDSRSVGCERLCLAALNDLAMPEHLAKSGLSLRDTRIAMALLIAKMCHPSSERETSRWLTQNSATGELLGLGTDTKALNSKTLYRVGDHLWKHRELLQKGLCDREQTLFDLPNTIVFYDLTNVHYTGRSDGTLRRFGRSKQKRNDCPLVTLAMTLNSAGFPRSCEILPGNVSEPKTLCDAIKHLEVVQGGDQKPTIVMDAGIATKDNLIWLTAQGYPWVCVQRGAKPASPEGEPDVTVNTTAGHDVRAWRLDNDGDEVQLYMVSDGKKFTGDAILASKRARFEAEMKNLQDGLSMPRRTKRHDKVLERVGRLKQLYCGVSQQYEVTVIKGVNNNATEVRCEPNQNHRQAEDTTGAYVLRTSHVDWDTEKIIQTYFKITDIEATFRSLKSDLDLRPIWHKTDLRISAHLFIPVLAYHGVHLIRTRLKAQGNNLSWASIRNRMTNWTRLTTTIKEIDARKSAHRVITIRQDVRPDAQAAAIARAVGAPPALHRRRSSASS